MERRIARTNLVFNVVTTYMMFYYTDVAGISLLSVGTLFLVVRVLDAVAGPVVGALIDKTHTKWGKVRPWFLWFGAPFAIIGVMAFSVPNFGGVIKMIYVYVTYIMMEFPRRHGDHAVHRAAAEPHHQRPGTCQCKCFPQCRRSDRRDCLWYAYSAVGQPDRWWQSAVGLYRHHDHLWRDLRGSVAADFCQYA